MAKNSKAKVTFNAQAFAVAGFSAARADDAAIAMIKTLAEKNVKAARNEFVAGYIAAKQQAGAETLTPHALVKAHVLMSMKGHKKDEPKAEGRRTSEQETLVNSGAKAWSRLAKLAGLERADNRGRKEGAKVGPTKAAHGADTSAAAKAAPVTVKVGKVANQNELVKVVHSVKQAWAALMVASKGLELPAEAAEIAVQVTTLINKYETAVAKAGK